jgi:hypothetical protein
MKQPLEFVNVISYKSTDTLNPTSFVSTDSLGRFKLTIDKNPHVLKFNLTGYEEKQIQLNLFEENGLDLGIITLNTLSQLLNGVEIVAKKSAIQKTKNGLVIDAAATLSQAGGTVVDILRNSPTVFVDGEGTVLLRGRSPMILINGRNSKLTNLQNIPSSTIDKIEIITNPSAEFDAEAENGIINIILKKGRGDGINGAFAIGAGKGEKGRFNSSSLLNFKKAEWNLGIAYDNRIANRSRNATGNRINYNLPNEYYLTQKRNDDRNEATHNLRLSVDHESDKHSISLEGIYELEDEINYETLFSTFETQQRSFTSKTRRFSEEAADGKVGELALNFEKKFKSKDKKFSILASTSFNDGTENTSINSQKINESGNIFGDEYLQQTNFSELSSVSNGRMDFSNKLGNGKLETGYKIILRTFENGFGQKDKKNGVFVEDANRTGIFDFEESVNAGYIQYKSGTSIFDYEFGLRGEYTINHGAIKSLNTDFDNRYFNIFPTANLGFTIDDAQNVRLIFGRRINRPRLGQLNPFTDITDSLTQRTGNPNLLPEFSDNIELVYGLNKSNNSYILMAFYRNGTNTILSFSELKPNGVLFSKLENIGSSRMLGLELIASQNIANQWQTNFSSSIYHQKIDASNIQAEVLNNVVSWNAKWINDFSLSKSSKLQVIGIYNSPTATIQGTRIAVYNTDLAFQKKLWKEKARIGVIVTDVFNTQKNGFTWQTKDFDFERIFKVDTRAILVTCAYTFGTKFKENLMNNKFSND